MKDLYERFNNSLEVWKLVELFGTSIRIHLFQ
ncbi:hypothetical protein TM_0004 [Thermotoga maritima MSB8]|uniref:Uncharacterized protein n=1 Tax=Thermotoga maritima (strain ATCC 43589 / DSM 3109 / JCM 10099 / NBRC 100826 / MSB8) TaxID=243274 RepID=Q9WXL9_THEMA|nr:hypothetical protein TM_0004 [Thermotoga maritima MSB8]